MTFKHKRSLPESAIRVLGFWKWINEIGTSERSSFELRCNRG
ncbi:hypothetical protein [uncultured Nostoc sp.]